MSKPDTIDLELMEKNLLELEPNADEFMDRRLNHRSFAKLIYWLCCQYAQKNIFIYVTELTKFMKYSQPRAYTVLRELCNIGLLKREERTSNLVEFHFVMNSPNPKIFKYLDRAKKTLEIE